MNISQFMSNLMRHLSIPLHFIGILLFNLVQSHTYGQSPAAEKAVEKVIHTFFDGMREGDSSKVSSTMTTDIIFLSSAEKDGEIVLSEGSATRFLSAVGTPHEEVWDERIWDLNIQVDDHLASAWMKYAFFRGSAFSHCGINHFLLAEEKDGWKVIHIADTRRKDNCQIPEDLKK